MSEVCELCGTALAETGAPIWETYCPNESCDREKVNMKKAIQLARRSTPPRRVSREELEKAARAIHEAWGFQICATRWGDLDTLTREDAFREARACFAAVGIEVDDG